MNSEERLQKLKLLQKRKAEASKQNRQELFKEHREQAVGRSKLRQLDKQQERAMEELEKLDTEEKGENYARKKAWDYTVEDNEKWDAKLAMRAANKKNAGFKNYSQMAEQSYNKEISQIEVIGLDEYKKQKEKSDGVDFNNKPSKSAIDALIGTLKSGDARRMKKKKDNDDTMSYSEYLSTDLLHLILTTCQ